MRIAIDYNAALRQHAGIGRYTRELVRAFSQLQSDDELVLFYAAHDLPPDHSGMRELRQLQAKFSQVRAVPIPLSERWLTIIWQRARLPIALERWTGPVDLIHAPDFVLPPVAAASMVLTVHDLSFRTHPATAHPSLRRYLDRAVPRSLACAMHVLVDSRHTKRDLQHLMGIPNSKVSVLYPGVGKEFKRETDTSRLEEVRVKYALPEQFLFFVGVLEPRKNLLRLMEAYEQVLYDTGSTPSDLQLVLAGKPGWMSDLIIARAQSTPGVRLLGFIDDSELPALYTLATATVYPSLYEGFGFPPLESLACGTPVVVSNTSSLPEVVGDVGVYVDPLDVRGIAAGIARLISDVQLAAALRRRGPEQAAGFTWERAAMQLQEVYCMVANGEQS